MQTSESDLIAASAAGTASDSIENDGVGRDVLEARALVLERAVKSSGTVPLDELSAIAPGGINNRDTSAMGWLHYLNQLHRYHATLLHGRSTTNGAARWDAQTLRDAQAATAAEALPVQLDCAIGKSVFPKGDFAIARLEYLDVAMTWVAVRHYALTEAQRAVAEQTGSAELSPDEIELLRTLIDIENYMGREYIWILTHPGADVPWPDDGQWDHEPPKWTRQHTSFDLIACRKAYHETSKARVQSVALRLQAITNAGDDPMPIEVFNGVMANELGVQPRQLVRQWSRGEVFMQALMKVEASNRATAAANKNK